MKNRITISWAFYDWANSAFATTVMAGFFPVFFKQYWAAGLDATQSTLQLGTANSLASLIIVALAPLLGAIADQGGAKKKFLLFFATMGIVMTGALFFVAQGAWLLAVAIYVFATLGFMGGNIFYDSLIVEVAEDKERDFVSGLGFALGYLGGGILFAVNVAMTTWPEPFGLRDASEAVRVSFICVSVWWALFSVPVFLFVKEPHSKKKIAGPNPLTAGIRQLMDTFRELRHLRTTFLFLLGYWLYIDGVDTIVRMAVDYGMSLGFNPNSLVAALLITQFVGFPAAMLFGKLGERFGAKTGIFLGIGVYIGVVTWAYYMDQEYEFYALAVAIGLVQGGIQSLSRSLYSRLIPRDRAAQFFGFYNMLGKFAAVIGPVMMGWVGVWTGNPRYSILSIIILFIAGAAILYFVDVEKGQRAAQELEGRP